MNFISRKSLLVVFSYFVLVSCTKTTNSAGTVTGPNIYVAGDNGTNAILWKNGKAELLSISKGSADQVTVSGNNVYVAGIDMEPLISLNTPAGPSGQYVYWSNGVENKIGEPVLIHSPASVSVTGGNIYYSNMSPWKNGVQITLPGQGFVTSTLAVGPDIYFMGSDSIGDAVYWKNGVLHVVEQGYYPASNGGSDPEIYCIYVSGDDVYVGGSNADNTAAYWKNGVATTLQSNISGSFVSNVHSLFVTGNDVYALGNLIVPANGGSNIPAYS
jgi:hypothetical protein